MPFRKRKARAWVGGDGALTDNIRAILTEGFDHEVPSRGLVNVNDMALPDRAEEKERTARRRAAWDVHRNQLMREESSPGRRPWGFYRFDLGMERPPERWFDELGVLLKHGLVSIEDGIVLEHHHVSLSPTVAVDAWLQNFGRNPGWIFPHSARQHEVEAQFHRWRGRSDIAMQFERLKALCEEFLGLR